MKKIFKIEIDCANCANLVEEAARRVSGVKDLSIIFMTQKMKVTFEEGADENSVMDRIVKTAKKIEPDFKILNLPPCATYKLRHTSKKQIII